MLDREWAEDPGYQRGRCPRCHATVWTDTGVFECQRCGYGGLQEGRVKVTLEAVVKAKGEDEEALLEDGEERVVDALAEAGLDWDVVEVEVVE